MTTYFQNISCRRIGYVGCIVFSIILMLIYKDQMEGLSVLGIALIFDPFDPLVPFNKRPAGQRILLLTHGLLVILLMTIDFIDAIFY